MNFGEKLLKLRKEKGWSQETLAEKVNTTRQAISKWENNAGYPETEKLLMLANVFEVSVDYLLKESKEEKGNEDKGYYVSKEMVYGYLANEKKVNRYIGMGLFCWLLSGSFYVMFSQDDTMRMLSMGVCAALGIACMIIAGMKEKEEYKILKQEPLLFDQDFLKELTKQYTKREKRYKVLTGICLILFACCIIPVFLSDREWLAWSDYHMFSFIGMALTAFGFIQCAGIMEMYELLIKNEQYHKKVSVRIMRKIRNKISEL